MRVKETKRQGRIAHHHTDATVPHIVALPGFSFHDAKISIILLISKFLSDFLPSSIIFLTSFIPIPTPHFIKLSRFCGHRGSVPLCPVLRRAKRQADYLVGTALNSRKQDPNVLRACLSESRQASLCGTPQKSAY